MMQGSRSVGRLHCKPEGQGLPRRSALSPLPCIVTIACTLQVAWYFPDTREQLRLLGRLTVVDSATPDERLQQVRARPHMPTNAQGLACRKMCSSVVAQWLTGMADAAICLPCATWLTCPIELLLACCRTPLSPHTGAASSVAQHERRGAAAVSVATARRSAGRRRVVQPRWAVDRRTAAYAAAFEVHDRRSTCIHQLQRPPLHAPTLTGMGCHPIPLQPRPKPATQCSTPSAW